MRKEADQPDRTVYRCAVCGSSGTGPKRTEAQPTPSVVPSRVRGRRGHNSIEPQLSGFDENK